MTTLTTFLLDRIAEDEEHLDVPDFVEVDSARGPGWGSRGDCPVCDAPQWDGSEAVTEEAWLEHADRTHQRSRILAECEAKRRIIAMHGELCFGNGDRGAGDEVLEHLAQVYADHPSFDPTWKA